MAMEENQLEQAVLFCVDPAANPALKKQVRILLQADWLDFGRIMRGDCLVYALW